MTVLLSDAEREAHIRDLGSLIVHSYQEGRRADAVEWSRLRAEAIASRSPEQIARMEADLDASLGYFSDAGAWDRSGMLGATS